MASVLTFTCQGGKTYVSVVETGKNWRDVRNIFLNTNPALSCDESRYESMEAAKKAMMVTMFTKMMAYGWTNVRGDVFPFPDYTPAAAQVFLTCLGFMLEGQMRLDQISPLVRFVKDSRDTRNDRDRNGSGDSDRDARGSYRDRDDNTRDRNGSGDREPAYRKHQCTICNQIGHFENRCFKNMNRRAPVSYADTSAAASAPLGEITPLPGTTTECGNCGGNHSGDECVSDA